MDPFPVSLRGELPEHVHDVLTWDFIPWSFVKNRHSDHPHTPLIALLESYSRLADILDLESLSLMEIPPDSEGCLRCGSCCAYLRPGFISGRTYRRWQKTGVPVALFYSPVKGKDPPTSYNCWFNKGVRLRMCPFLMLNRVDLKPFCCIHHMGKDYRPGACSRFAPNPPVCQEGNFVPVP